MSGTDRFISINGLRLHYVEHGEPSTPAIVCLHGGGAHGHAWDTFASLVRDRFHVLALTFRGHGDSDRADRYGNELLTLDAAEFIRATGVAPAVVAGHSLGAGPAIAIAALWPALASHLVIVDASIHPNPGGWNRIIASMHERPESFETAEEAVAWFRSHIPGLPDDELRRYIEVDLIRGVNGRYRRKTDPKMAAMGLAMSEEDAALTRRQGETFLRHALQMISCPTLLVRGTRSDILTPEIANEMVSLMKDGRLVEIDAQHAVFQERPREFADAVLDFLHA